MDIDAYPNPGEVDIDCLEKQIPLVLHELIKNMFDKPHTSSANLRQRILIASVCHILMQASHQSFMSPLLLSTGLFIHQTTRSRVALNLLSGLGVSVSYDQVINFEKAAAVTQTSNATPQATQGDAITEVFCQWVADNFDYNEDTLNGQQTTHVMGIVTCQTPAKTSNVQVQRGKVSSSDILSAGNFGNVIRPYKQPVKNLMSAVRFKEIPKVSVSTQKFLELDTLWLLASIYNHSAPNWQGFMSEISKGHCICTSVTYNRIIPLRMVTEVPSLPNTHHYGNNGLFNSPTRTLLNQ